MQTSVGAEILSSGGRPSGRAGEVSGFSSGNRKAVTRYCRIAVIGLCGVVHKAVTVVPRVRQECDRISDDGGGRATGFVDWRRVPGGIGGVGVVVALDVDRILGRDGEAAGISGGSGGAVGHVAERSIDQFQNVTSAADPILARGVGTRRNAVVGIRAAVGISRSGAGDQGVEVLGRVADGAIETEAHVLRAKVIEGSVLIDIFRRSRPSGRFEHAIGSADHAVREVDDIL